MTLQLASQHHWVAAGGSALPHFFLLFMQPAVDLLACPGRLSVKHNGAGAFPWCVREGCPGSSPGFRGEARSCPGVS